MHTHIVFVLLFYCNLYCSFSFNSISFVTIAFIHVNLSHKHVAFFLIHCTALKHFSVLHCIGHRRLTHLFLGPQTGRVSWCQVTRLSRKEKMHREWVGVGRRAQLAAVKDSNTTCHLLMTTRCPSPLATIALRSSNARLVTPFTDGAWCWRKTSTWNRATLTCCPLQAL